MSRRRIVLFSLFLCVLAGLVAPAGSPARADVRMVPSTGPDGPVMLLVHEQPDGERTPPGSGDSSAGLAGDGTRDVVELWHRFIANPIYTSLGLSGAASRVFAGDYANAPQEAESIPLLGDGTPEWVSPGNELYTDAARNADVLAAVDARADSTVIVSEWRAGSSTPLWSFAIHPCRPLTNEGWSSGKSVECADDGTTIAVVVNMYTPAGLKARLVLFNSGSGTPLAEVPLDGSASALQITPNGQFTAVYTWPDIYVYDRSNGMRWSGSAGSGNDALAISADGNYLAWGWSTLNLRQWNGTTYGAFWSTTKSGYYVTECAITPGADKLAVAWYNGATLSDDILDLYALPAHTLIWSHNYGGSRATPPEPGRTTVDVVSEMVISQDGQYLAASSWGPDFPELQVYNLASPVPVALLDTPGTMFDVDIVRYPGGGLYAAACGKNVHAGQAGHGGDAYALQLEGGSGVREGSGPAGASLRVSPNPAGGPAWIGFRSEAGPLRLTVHDAAGRLVTTLADGIRPAGAQSVLWDGRDDSGRRVAAGTYFLRLESMGQPVRGGTVLVR